MKNYILYSHAGSYNHGCEALLRTTVETIGNVKAVYSGNVISDRKYNLDKIVELREDKAKISEGFLNDLIYKIKYKLTKDDKIYFKKLYKKFIDEIDSNYTYLSIGGDNYCYHFSEWLEVLNDEINKKSAVSVLWGCSINEDELNNQSLLKDLEKYKLITARETLTYGLLKQKLNKPQIEYVPDTAFILPTSEVSLPLGFERDRTIGINISPVIVTNAYDDSLLNYFLELVNYIIKNTNYQIALIPHVVISGNDDRIALQEVYNKCIDKSRVIMIEDANSTVLKGYISKCKLFIGARTHSTIAAYSSFIPTLTIGYSIKSIGIAQDLFGSYENYVQPVQLLKSSDQLIDSFKWLEKNQNFIREKLEKKVPNFIERIGEAKELLEGI